jgi:hypothetical protein
MVHAKQHAWYLRKPTGQAPPLGASTPSFWPDGMRAKVGWSDKHALVAGCAVGWPCSSDVWRWRGHPIKPGAKSCQCWDISVSLSTSLQAKDLIVLANAIACHSVRRQVCTVRLPLQPSIVRLELAAAMNDGSFPIIPFVCKSLVTAVKLLLGDGVCGGRRSRAGRGLSRLSWL